MANEVRSLHPLLEQDVLGLGQLGLRLRFQQLRLSIRGTLGFWGLEAWIDGLEDAGGRYQICGPNAFNRYGFDDQIPIVTYAYNNRFSGTRRIGSVLLSLIKVSDKRLGATDSVETRDGLLLVYSSKLRTLIDAVYDWSRFNGLPRAYGWIRKEIGKDSRSADKLVQLALAYGNQGTMRRLIESPVP